MIGSRKIQKKEKITGFIVASLIIIAGYYGFVRFQQTLGNQMVAAGRAHFAAVFCAALLHRDAEAFDAAGWQTALHRADPLLGDLYLLKGSSFILHPDKARLGTELQDIEEDKSLYDMSRKLRSMARENPSADQYIAEQRKAGKLVLSEPLQNEQGRNEGLVQVSYLVPRTRTGIRWLPIGLLAAVAVGYGLLVGVIGRWHWLVGVLLLACSIAGIRMTILREAPSFTAAVAASKAQMLCTVSRACGDLNLSFQELMPALTMRELPASSLGSEVAAFGWQATAGAASGTRPAETANAQRLACPQGGEVVLELNHGALDLQCAQIRLQANRFLGVLLVFALLIWGYGAGGLAYRTASALRTHAQAYTYIFPAVLGMFALVFLPLLYGVVLAFFRVSHNAWTFAGIKNFIEILVDIRITKPESFYFTLVVTVLWTVVNVSLHVSIGLALALVLNRQGLKFKRAYRVLLILPWAIPNYITALIWRGMFHRQFGAVNALLVWLGIQPISWFNSFWTSFAAIVLTNTWLGFPFMMVIALGALQSIPGEIYEAAEVDGAGRRQQFRRITLPLLKPALVPAIILGTIWTFNMFIIIYLVSNGAPNGSTDILIVRAYRFAFESSAWGIAAAYSIIIFIILLTFGVMTNRITRATEGAFD